MTDMVREFKDVPKHVSIEITSHCNRDCYFCPRWGDRSGKRKDHSGNSLIHFMPSEKVVSLLNQVWEIGYRGNMNFHHLSEPFVDKRLLSFARRAKEIGFRPIVHTNGDVLKGSTELVDEVVDVFDEITIGLYDYQSEAERLEAEGYWMGILKKAKNLHFTHHEIVFPRHDVDVTKPRMSLLGKAVESARNLPCYQVREHLIIHYDGNVALCCEDYVDQFTLGNVFDKSICEIWWGDKRKEVIDILSRPGGRMNYPHCQMCPYSPDQHLYTIKKSGETPMPSDNTYAIEIIKKKIGLVGD